MPPSLLADVFESLVAAIYLDGASGGAAAFVTKFVAPEIELAVNGDLEELEITIQQVAQHDMALTPTYQLLDEKGPDHSKCIKISAQVGQHRYHPAWGRKGRQRAPQRPQHSSTPRRCCLRSLRFCFPSSRRSTLERLGRVFLRRFGAMATVASIVCNRSKQSARLRD